MPDERAGAQGWVSRERKFFLRGEDANAHAAQLLHLLTAANDERRLGKIRFVREFLHLCRTQASGILEDGELISPEMGCR